jgi:hypothetical protein
LAGVDAADAYHEPVAHVNVVLSYDAGVCALLDTEPLAVPTVGGLCKVLIRELNYWYIP